MNRIMKSKKKIKIIDIMLNDSKAYIKRINK